MKFEAIPLWSEEQALIEQRRRASEAIAQALGVPRHILGVDLASGPDRTVYHWRSGPTEKTEHVRFRGGHPGGGKTVIMYDEVADVVFPPRPFGAAVRDPFIGLENPLTAIRLVRVDGVWRRP